MASALTGLSVVDLSESVGGQYCARLLADFGAEVVLVEPPDGSVLRRMPPFSEAGDRGSLLFFHLNTGKRSVSLDLGSAGGRDALDGLLRMADVAILPPGSKPQRVLALNPHCIAAVVSPFGADGPLSAWKGPEIVLQALSGMMHNNGAHGREPLYGCGRRASFAAGIAAYIGVTAALYARERTGLGQTVTVDEAETAAAMCFPYVLQHIYNGTVKGRGDPNIPAGQVRCRDGWVCIWIYNHRWSALCRALGLEHLERDERFSAPTPRRARWAALFEIIQDKVAGLEAEQLVAELQRAEVIAAKAYRPSELRASSHLNQRGYWEAVGEEVILGPPFRMSRTPRRVRSGAPRLGADNGGPRGTAPAGWRTRQSRADAVIPGTGPLAGLRVLELTTAWAGPMAGRVLGFLGAEAIHVESPTRVNSWRLNKEVPNPVNFPDGDPGARPYDRAFQFNSQNVNKLSCILDLKTGEGREIIRRLAAVSDVVICNFRPGTLAKLGLDYDSLRRIRPDIIVAELPAFGAEGPMARYAALGPTMEMSTGMSSMIGYPGGQPETTGPSYLDPIGGFNAAAGILTALLHRQRTGEGQYIEVPQVEAAMQLIGPELLAAIETGRDPAPNGNRSPHAAPHDAFPVRGDDQWVAIAAETEAEWQTLCGVMGHPGLAADPRFATLTARQENIEALTAIIADWTRSQDKHAVAARLQAAGVPAAPVQTPEDLARSGYLAHRGFFTVLEHADAGRHPHPGLPIHLAATPGSQRRAAPCFGADNRRVLRDILGMTPAEIAAVEASGAMATEPRPGA
ncbi:CoA transferase [Inquilinus limosus]|uniref:CaiB/BaiF CoA transferase family protein n=1 Tax=Inquilinus limosus TaxID=171674 RepID=UPI003F17D80B